MIDSVYKKDIDLFQVDTKQSMIEPMGFPEMPLVTIMPSSKVNRKFSVALR